MNCPNCKSHLNNSQKILLTFKSVKCSNCNKVLKFSVKTKLAACIPLLISTFIPLYWTNRTVMIICIFISAILGLLIMLRFPDIDTFDKYGLNNKLNI